MPSRDMQLIICTFDSTKAEEARAAIQALDKRLDTLTLGNIAVVEKTADGELHIQETKDFRAGIERVAGTVAERVTEFLFTFAGLLGSNPGPAEMTGQFEGSRLRNRTESVVHRLVHDMGFPDSGLRHLGEQLDAGRSALILLVKPDEEPVVVAELQRLEGKIMQHSVASEIVAQLQS